MIRKPASTGLSVLLSRYLGILLFGVVRGRRLCKAMRSRLHQAKCFLPRLITPLSFFSAIRVSKADTLRLQPSSASFLFSLPVTSRRETIRSFLRAMLDQY